MDQGRVFERLLKIASDNSLQLKFVPFENYYGRLKGDKIGLSIDMDIKKINYTLAHELAHYFLHFDKGDTINSNSHRDYEEQADRAAKMLLAAVAL